MALINITRKASTLQAEQLNAPSDMTDSLTYLSSRGYVGQISLSKVGSTLTWQLVIQDVNGTVSTGVIGDWLIIENDAIATIVPASKAPALYQAS